MRIALTGATGFLGRYILRQFARSGHTCRAWRRAASNIIGIESLAEWLPGELGNADACQTLVDGCDAVVHSALAHRPGQFHGGEGADLVDFARRNVIGSLELIEAAREAGVPRFIFISTCAVHDVILDDRPLDEAHPTWAKSHYGAHKAAIENFVHSFGFGQGYDICALRPCGIYGLAHQTETSKWYGLVASVARGETVTCQRGGKEVHVADVARAVDTLLTAQGIAGHSYNCCEPVHFPLGRRPPGQRILRYRRRNPRPADAAQKPDRHQQTTITGIRVRWRHKTPRDDRVTRGAPSSPVGCMQCTTQSQTGAFQAPYRRREFAFRRELPYMIRNHVE